MQKLLITFLLTIFCVSSLFAQTKNTNSELGEVKFRQPCDKAQAEPQR